MEFEDLELVDEIDQLTTDLEGQGWKVHKVFPQGIRYWCPCGNHETWVLTEPDPNPTTYVAEVRGRLARTTCWEGEQ